MDSLAKNFTINPLNYQVSPLQPLQNPKTLHIHPAKSKPFFTQILQARSHMIDHRIIKYQKPVMRDIRPLDRYRRILSIVLFHIELELFGDRFGVEGDVCILIFAQKRQHALVDIVVDEPDGVFGRFDELGDERICIKYLSIVENALRGAQ